VKQLRTIAEDQKRSAAKEPTKAAKNLEDLLPPGLRNQPANHPGRMAVPGKLNKEAESKRPAEPSKKGNAEKKKKKDDDDDEDEKGNKKKGDDDDD
jgi:hypothetical protein